MLPAEVRSVCSPEEDGTRQIAVAPEPLRVRPYLADDVGEIPDSLGFRPGPMDKDEPGPRPLRFRPYPADDVREVPDSLGFRPGPMDKPEPGPHPLRFGPCPGCSSEGAPDPLECKQTQDVRSLSREASTASSCPCMQDSKGSRSPGGGPGSGYCCGGFAPSDST